MMKHLFTTAAALAVVLSSSTAMAQVKPKNIGELNAHMASHGCKQHLIHDGEEDDATLLVTCDQDAVRTDKNLRTWFFASEAANRGDIYFNSNRDFVTASFLEYESMVSLLLYYRTTNIDQLAVIGRIMGRDDYGHPIDYIAFTYGFDRDIYRKTDPEHIKTCGTRHISKDFFPMPRAGIENNCPVMTRN